MKLSPESKIKITNIPITFKSFLVSLWYPSTQYTQIIIFRQPLLCFYVIIISVTNYLSIQLLRYMWVVSNFWLLKVRMNIYMQIFL